MPVVAVLVYVVATAELAEPVRVKVVFTGGAKDGEDALYDHPEQGARKIAPGQMKEFLPALPDEGIDLPGLSLIVFVQYETCLYGLEYEMHEVVNGFMQRRLRS